MKNLWAVWVAIVLLTPIAVSAKTTALSGGGNGGGGGGIGGGTISGFVLDGQTFKPALSQDYPFTAISLSSFNEWGSRDFEAFTDCYPVYQQLNGCVDRNGYFNFDRRYDGNLLRCGQYLMEVWAWQYLLARAEFDHQCDDTHTGVTFIERQPVVVNLLDTPWAIPSNGGLLSWAFRIANVSSQRQSVEVSATMEGPAETDFWVQFLIKKANYNLEAGRSTRVLEWSVPVPEAVPNGSYYCVYVKAAQNRHPYRPLNLSVFCVLKGDQQTVLVDLDAVAEGAAVLSTNAKLNRHIQLHLKGLKQNGIGLR